MSTYYWGSGLSYTQYLQARSFVDDVKHSQNRAAKAVKLEVSRQTRELIASQESLAKENIRCLESGFSQVAAATERGFETLSWDIQDVSRGLGELNSTFQWGFSEMINQLTRLNSAVSELVKIAKTPVQTAANEHFQIARDAFRQGLYMEALEEGAKAIDAYKLEWRFHSLIGTIRLGNVSGGFELIDLHKAEESFLLAARYAKADYAEDAGRAYLAASWAAYCQGKMGPALSHVEEALKLHPRLAEAMFQAGKIYMALGEPDSALNLLGGAISIDKGYALKAAGDGDFKRYEQQLRDYLAATRNEKARRLRPIVQEALNKYAFWLSRSDAARNDPLVVQANAFLNTVLPLWDLLTRWDELAKLSENLAKRCGDARFVEVIRLPGPEYEIEETYTEHVPAAAGFLRRLAGDKQKQRTVKKNGLIEQVAFKSATGAVDTAIEFHLVPQGRTSLHKRNLDGVLDSRRIRITRAFLVSTTAITIGQYAAVMHGSSASGQLDLPIASLSWFDAISYCNGLSREVGVPEAYDISPRGVKWRGPSAPGYRLLTEGEWERACWGDSSDVFSSLTEEQIDRIAWVKENSGGRVHAVAGKQPNSWGLYDMLGNVAEWLWDWAVVGTYWYVPTEDPTGPNEVIEGSVPAAGGPMSWQASVAAGKAVVSAAQGKIARGGSCLNTDQHIRGGAPGKAADPNSRSAEIGFRVARTVLE